MNLSVSPSFRNASTDLSPVAFSALYLGIVVEEEPQIEGK